jgi:hypothetical protein
MFVYTYIQMASSVAKELGIKAFKRMLLVVVSVTTGSTFTHKHNRPVEMLG